jgi:hypothetical protein
MDNPQLSISSNFAQVSRDTRPEIRRRPGFRSCRVGSNPEGLPVVLLYRGAVTRRSYPEPPSVPSGMAEPPLSAVSQNPSLVLAESSRQVPQTPPRCCPLARRSTHR